MAQKQKKSCQTQYPAFEILLASAKKRDVSESSLENESSLKTFSLLILVTSFDIIYVPTINLFFANFFFNVHFLKEKKRQALACCHIYFCSFLL